ncbi:alpha/beta hydrolase family domain-containing protein [Rhizoctonia solani AG-1 IA]|uniref:Alpha/beta hydrolase family domain-containing protein n=1 Tax=Thanatephorus cucumeris (strain AG1-IA) TaxID=983506 RepID=L8WUI2_THACA|nr:alpha/beta hydrolase family domain-containing protein [Rhizoctonia solani AG-1 IA]
MVPEARSSDPARVYAETRQNGMLKLTTTMSSTQAERKTIFDSKTLTKKGLCPVTIIKDQASDWALIEVSTELHGRGPEKILCIMGRLNSSSFSWQHQVEHFGPLEKYSILVFDNRGVGHSDAPRGPYTYVWMCADSFDHSDITANRTSGMAEDVITLLDHIGWTEERQLHVVGISMGGMVAQELATRIPRRIVSLVLAVTSAGGHIWNNFPPDPAVKVQMIMDMVFPLSWLAGPSAADPKITNREAQTRLYMTRILATTPQTLMGTVSQMAAGLSHRVTPDRLRQIANDIPKIVLVTGDEDNLVPPQCSEWIKQCMGPNVKLEKWEQTGHALQIQRPERFNALVEKVIEESRAL